jgi:DNA-directed RNA polymerase specialized sigma24 family protein
MAALQLATIILAWGKFTAPLAGLIFVLGELQRHFLRDAIELLQPLDKAVLVLSDFEDLSNEDMPAALQDRLLSFLQTRLTRVPQACQGGRDQG